MHEDHSLHVITSETAAGRLDWPGAVGALRAGHALPRAQIADTFLGPATATMMTRSAFIAGLGYGAKPFTVFDGNAAKGLPTVQGGMLVFDKDDGHLRALVENRLITGYKTAADSVLGASLLARPDSRRLLIVGAGAVAASLIEAYASVLPEVEDIAVWARRPEQAQALLDRLDHVPARLSVAPDLPDAVGRADIISTTTMAREPVILGDWVRPGTHVDLIGAYKADMREADDRLMARARLFVDSRETTAHIGELLMPMASGAITADSVLGDLYDLLRPDARPRRSDDDITVFKNGGGAHLDLMIASWIIDTLSPA
ncbi:ornithine cyclodeaminase [uncultured Paracoccus sp.]|uniref:ornithine cyclodeaminase family protein n=1 Tax=uncultured Paracoccus sp. TaxID=189685 RepID=UPI0025DE85D5|nr:ornithine cyclodeaminase [uncultured Paracoccus sp.]